MKFIIFFLLPLMLSCDNEMQENCIYDGCDSRRKTIKVADNIVGRVSILSQHYPDTWVIISKKGIIGDGNMIYDGSDIIVICNLPDSIKFDGQKVVFSGKLKDSCDDFDKWVGEIYYCIPTYINKIKN